MAHLRESSIKSPEVPTEETWAEAKEEQRRKMTKLPFTQKLRVLDNLRRDDIKWSNLYIITKAEM